jgi:hypothetical protein
MIYYYISYDFKFKGFKTVKSKGVVSLLLSFARQVRQKEKVLFYPGSSWESLLQFRRRDFQFRRIVQVTRKKSRTINST